MSLIFLFIYIYACLGMNLFSGVMHQNNITDKANFESLGNSLLTLFRCSTGEGWNNIMADLANTQGFNGV